MCERVNLGGGVLRGSVRRAGESVRKIIGAGQRMRHALSAVSLLNHAARSKSMRRRSRLEANLANGRSPTPRRRRRYLLYGAMGVLSLALPAALTLRGNRPSPPKPEPSARIDSGATIGGGDRAHGSEISTQPRWKGRDVQDLGAISPLVWGGIGDGIAATPASADDIHVVFSTDCSPYQNYQAILLFHSAEVRGASVVLKLSAGAVHFYGKYVLYLEWSPVFHMVMGDRRLPQYCPPPATTVPCRR